MKRSDVAELQKRLTGLGFDAGAADGLLGPKTRAALKGFQRSRNLPADGYPTREALALLRGS